jgi:hydrogenase/urease accessory protein HupE
MLTPFTSKWSLKSCTSYLNPRKLRGSAFMRYFIIFIGFVPYAILASYDFWLHGRARQVPLIEQIIHAGLALALGVFLSLVAAAKTVAALSVLGVFTILLSFDEFGFHAKISAHERHVHWLADTALLGFVLYWLWLDGVIDGWL